MEQYVDSPTRKGAILDLVLGNEPGQVVKVSVGEHVANSDHNSVKNKEQCSTGNRPFSPLTFRIILGQ